jgi:hypothetical protein
LGATLSDLNIKMRIPMVKKGAHVGKMYHGLTKSGAEISPILVRQSNENLRIIGLFEVKQGKQNAKII